MSTQPADTRNDAQRAFDSATKPVPIDLTHGLGNALNSTLGNLGGGGLSLATPLFHPIATAHGLRDLVTPQSATEQGASLLGPGVVPILHMVSSAVNAVKPKNGETFGQNAARAGGDAISALGSLIGGVGVGESIGMLGDLIPSAARAGETLNSIQQQVGHHPVEMTRSMPLLERAQQLSERGHGTITPLDSLYKRVNTVNPLDYAEARDRYSALTDLTGNDRLNATKTLQAGAKKFNRAFREDIGDVAASAGRGEDYNRALREYAQASRLRDLLDTTKRWAIPTIAGAAGASQVPRFIRAFEGQ